MVSSSISEIILKLIKDTIPEVLGDKVTEAFSDSIPSCSFCGCRQLLGKHQQGNAIVITGSNETKDT